MADSPFLKDHADQFWKEIERNDKKIEQNATFARILVLQFPLVSQAAAFVAFLSDLLVGPPPAGPGHDLGEPGRWASRGPHESDEEAADLRDRDRDVARAPGRARRPPFLVAIVSTAKASRARVMWRYQPCQLRTS